MGASKRKLRVAQVLLAGLLAALPVAADKVDDLLRQLGADSDFKVRLSAALNLGKLGDKRAVPGLIIALRDADKTVRGVAAAALGKMVDAGVPRPVIDRTIGELLQTAKSDPDGFVRGQAERAVAAVRQLTGGPETGTKSVYVEVGPMADSTKGGGASLRPVMRTTVTTAIVKKAPSYLTAWPGGKSPSRAELAKAGAAAAFYVDGTLTSLAVVPRGKMVEISCNVSLLIATYPDKSMFAFPSGGGVVQTDAAAQSVEEGRRDCVVAVLEDVVKRQVVPVIQARVP